MGLFLAETPPDTFLGYRSAVERVGVSQAAAGRQQRHLQDLLNPGGSAAPSVSGSAAHGFAFLMSCQVMHLLGESKAVTLQRAAQGLARSWNANREIEVKTCRLVGHADLVSVPLVPVTVCEVSSLRVEALSLLSLLLLRR